MKICGIDFETTGLSPTEDRIIEVGAVLLDWETKTPLQFLSRLVNPEREISEEITAITGITNELVEDHGHPENSVIGELCYLLSCSDYAMAHNGTTFDKPFFDASIQRCAINDPKISWLDTKTDIRYPERITTRNLRHLASEHEFLNPFAHRAVFDVLTMLRVAGNYDLREIIARSKETTVFARALVSFDDKEKAKSRGYYWNAPLRIWWRSFKESDYQIEKESCGFQTVLLDRNPEGV